MFSFLTNSDSRHGPACVQEAAAVVQNSILSCSEDGTETYEINGFRISQAADGLVKYVTGIFSSQFISLFIHLSLTQLTHALATYSTIYFFFFVFVCLTDWPEPITSALFVQVPQMDQQLWLLQQFIAPHRWERLHIFLWGKIFWKFISL